MWDNSSGEFISKDDHSEVGSFVGGKFICFIKLQDFDVRSVITFRVVASDCVGSWNEIVSISGSGGAGFFRDNECDGDRSRGS